VPGRSRLGRGPRAATDPLEVVGVDGQAAAVGATVPASRRNSPSVGRKTRSVGRERKRSGVRRRSGWRGTTCSSRSPLATPAPVAARIAESLTCGGTLHDLTGSAQGVVREPTPVRVPSPPRATAPGGRRSARRPRRG